MSLPSRLVALMFCLLAFVAVHSQSGDWNDFVQEYAAVVEGETDESLLERQLDALSYYYENPIDLNAASSVDLQQLPFLSPAQVDSIASYVKRRRPLRSIGELAGVAGLHYRERRWLECFVVCRVADSIASRRPLRHLAVVNAGVPLYRRAAYGSYTPEQLDKAPNKIYHGPPLSHTWRYRGQLGRGVTAGVTLQNDEGEPLASHGNRVFDHQSAYLMVQGGRLVRRAIVGDYRVTFGEGLSMGYGLWCSPLSKVCYQQRQQQTFMPHTSAEELRYMRGGAVSLSLNGWELSAFASQRDIDATLRDGQAYTLLTSGLHRTASEIARHGNLRVRTSGLSLRLQRGRWSVGAYGVLTGYSLPLMRGTPVYRRYFPEGRHFTNLGLTYAAGMGNLSLRGEAASNAAGGWALMNSLQWLPSHGLRLTALYRYYDRSYTAPNAWAYSLGGHVRNEHGLLAGACWTASRQWQLTAYLDVAQYPFATTRATRTSYGLKGYAQAVYTPAKTVRWTVRYQLRTSQSDNADSTMLLLDARHSLRLAANYATGPVQHVSSADMCMLASDGRKARWGKMLSHRASARLGRWHLAGLMAWFNTDDYATALYLYEPQLTYTYSFGSNYYHGLRAVATASLRMGRCDLSLRYAATRYTDRSTISSGQQLINHSTKQDIALQLLTRF